jgi:hypothetical protein
MNKLFLVLPLIAACTQSAAGVAALEAAPTCRELSDRALALVDTLDRRCDTDDDCVRIGGSGSCDCAPTLTTGSGVTLGQTGAADPELGALAAEFARRCTTCAAGAPCSCDAAPARLSCVDQLCTATARSCLDRPGDAGF